MIRQVIVVYRDDFSGVIQDGSKTKSSEEDEQFLSGIETVLRKLLGDYQGPFRTLGIPSTDWQVRLTQRPPRDLPSLERLVIGVGFRDPADLNQFRKAVEDVNDSARVQSKREPVLGVGADLFLAETEYFSCRNRIFLSRNDRSDPVRRQKCRRVA